MLHRPLERVFRHAKSHTVADGMVFGNAQPFARFRHELSERPESEPIPNCGNPPGIRKEFEIAQSDDAIDLRSRRAPRG